MKNTMKVLSILAVAILLAMPVIQGCSIMPQSTRHEVIPVKQKQVLSMTIVEGKTTKQEILNTLGDPNIMAQGGFSYHRTNTTSYRIHLVQKDGTNFDFEVAEGKNYSMYISFDVKSNYTIVSAVGY